MIAKSLTEQRQQPVTVPDFFDAHLFKHLGGRRVRLPQAVGKLTIIPALFFLFGYGQRQNLCCIAELVPPYYHGCEEVLLFAEYRHAIGFSERCLYLEHTTDKQVYFGKGRLLWRFRTTL